jgi:hypothetical protein
LKLQQLELTTEVDSLAPIELMIGLEDAFNVKFVESSKVQQAGGREGLQLALVDLARRPV